jgi:hypothetical protein
MLGHFIYTLLDCGELAVVLLLLALRFYCHYILVEQV